jgi:hypothetical protein
MTIMELIDTECQNLAEMLKAKNRAYGNSFADPANIFCKLPAMEQLKVRIDDKLNRIAKGQNLEAVQEDTILDLIGYLVLIRVLHRLEAKS